jgi:hypothetical protein
MKKSQAHRVIEIVEDEEALEVDELQDLALVYKSASQAYDLACTEKDRLYAVRSEAIEALVNKAGSKKLEIDGKKIYAVKRQGLWYIKGESKDEGFVSVT